MSNIKLSVYNYCVVFNNQNYKSVEQQKTQLRESQ